MVTLLGVAMTTAGSCDSSSSYLFDTEGGGTTGTGTPPVVEETNPDEVDKSTIEAFKKYNDRLIQGINSYTEEEKDTIIAYAGYILNELPRYEEAIKKIGDQGDQTGSQSLIFIKAKDFVQLAQAVEGPAKDIQAWNDDVLNYLNEEKEKNKDFASSQANNIINKLPVYKNYLEQIRDWNTSTINHNASNGQVTDLEEKLDDVSQKLEDQESKLTNKINMLVLALSVGSILLVVALVVTIVYFHNKLKKVSQSLATACPSGQENADKETQTANGKVQKEMNDLRQHLDNVESQVKRVSAGIGNLEYRLNQSYPQPAPPTLQPAPLTPQPASPTLPMNNGICLYAELDAASTSGSIDELVPALLVRQVQSAVRMEDTIHRLAELGVDRVIEIGPGRVLSGLVRKTEPGIACTSVETVSDIESLAS